MNTKQIGTYIQAVIFGALLMAGASWLDLRRHGGYADDQDAQDGPVSVIESLPTDVPRERPGPWRAQARVCLWPAPPWADDLPGGVHFPLRRDFWDDEDYCLRLGHRRYSFDGSGCAMILNTRSGESYVFDSWVQRPCSETQP